MIERFYDPCEGKILFNGVDIRNLDGEIYHQQVGIVQQEPILFAGTVADNIIFGMDLDHLSDDQVRAMIDEACKMAFCYDFIHDKALFPDGYDTVCGERGVKLSGGQKQRIAIARALIRKPQLLLLDEATSALDAESEHQVQQALDNLIENGLFCIIVIAHRLSTIKNADEIIVMEKGEVKERGKHDELIALGGVYKNLVNRQLIIENLKKEVAQEKEAKEDLSN